MTGWFLQPGAYIEHFVEAAGTLARAAGATPFSLPIPRCPGWDVAELLRHTGAIHDMARGMVQGIEDPAPAPERDEDLLDWYQERARMLEAVLRTTDPASPCRTLAPPEEARFWMRRQAHETTIHRLDAERASAKEGSVDAEFAWDGVDEVVATMWPRQRRLGRTRSVDVALVLDAAEFSDMIRLGDEGLPAVTLSGPAELLYRCCWGRLGPEDPRLDCTDRAAAAKVFASHIVP